MKKIIALIAIIVLIIVGIIIWKVNSNNNKQGFSSTKLNETEGLAMILSLDDEITNNSIWCGTFQLIWNDLKNDLAKQDIVFMPTQLKVVENLNKETFKESDISEQYIYKKLGIANLELKKEIEKGIKEKFNETSDILDDFDWRPKNEDEYFLYAMLRKNFNFNKVFEEWENGKFKNTDNVKYFGVKSEKIKDYKNQVRVLYYKSNKDFAIKLITDKEDEVILCKNPKGNTFNEIFKNIQEESTSYTGDIFIQDGDKIKIPNIKVSEKNEFTEIENKDFMFSTGEIYYISKALQTIQLELDKTGGKIKSEAGMMVTKNAMQAETNKPREFYLDDTFAIFLIEKDKNVPYFAGKIDDITKFQ